MPDPKQLLAELRGCHPVSAEIANDAADAIERLEAEKGVLVNELADITQTQTLPRKPKGVSFGPRYWRAWAATKAEGGRE